MNLQPKDETTKVGAGTEEVDLNTASPTGHEEIESAIAAEAKGNSEAPRPRAADDRSDKKPLEPEQPQNPKRQQNSRPD